MRFGFGAHSQCPGTRRLGKQCAILAAIVLPISNVEACYLKDKAHVDKLTQAILAKAFRGELVPQDPDDEPASVLLERIKAEKENN